MSIVRFNPKSQTYVSQKSDGTFAPKAVSHQGIISNRPPQKGEPQILSQHQATANQAVKILP
ncbi:hypothetical protein TthWC1_2375 [Thermoanaerobacter thermohydrosulfuricus WC1]|uniref:Uncharacterized protein n=1 Tax=Thermoanaerobacter thermohydrosulfuricus WC1 TaxID=1198630 RepID=M8CLM6_THETY|nr:hypothetical protein [Thermoanaerobacter thermohydrosulfuricus]EMT38130.1 hypothetical protein TthWC1_2375 [Thermoanaerobacter thermohydrosulfuricus WC1]